MKARRPDGTFDKRRAECHPDKSHKGNGLCTTCYSRERATRHRDENRERSRQWYWANRERAIAASSQWVRDNRERHRVRRLGYRYGLTDQDVDAMMERQGHVCAVCQGPFQERPAVDHDHATGAVRGLLHFKCNAGLGAFGDDPAVLRRAAAYLELPR